MKPARLAGDKLFSCDVMIVQPGSDRVPALFLRVRRTLIWVEFFHVMVGVSIRFMVVHVRMLRRKGLVRDHGVGFGILKVKEKNLMRRGGNSTTCACMVTGIEPSNPFADV